MNRERFAPSPTGLLHPGHAFSALTAFEAARDGSFVLRIEDIDVPRSRPEYETAIYEDLAWLGIDWPMPVLRQSRRIPDHERALQKLINMGLCYPCSCTRKDIQAALSAPQEGSDIGPDGVIYPGTCRGRPMSDRTHGDAVRLDMRKAVAALKAPLRYTEIGESAGDYEVMSDTLVTWAGDVVMARKDIGTSYHLAVVVDDAAQHITHVTRGMDMMTATPIHVLLQKLLGYPTPLYRHHRLIRDDAGRRLAKRHDALTLRALRHQGKTPADIRAMVGL
ncbi:MAG: tRNA glutamyl-Q(34) synthetase GluQRS [Rhodobacteraceae bacterium]|nr:tRNA glutamyl-Q(34) synthetase GluQRS [Paracoccaceae bacterium]